MNLKYVLIGIACSFITASIGGSLTTLDQWYFSLQQPNWKPPDSLFPVIWSIIFIFIGISFGVSYGKAGNTENKRKLIFCFLFNALLNILWSFLYFYLKRPDFALLEVVFLWGSI
ncbi:MAG: TspO protein, partial [Proteobacteria bacterium]|nr:TspO protein [Pseudomonadota bacterium]